MKLKRIIAGDMKQAMQLIRAELGPDAIIIQAQMQKRRGLSKLWRKPQMEVLAAIDEEPLLGQPTRLVTPRQEPQLTSQASEIRMAIIEKRLDEMANSIVMLSAQLRAGKKEEGMARFVPVSSGIRESEDSSRLPGLSAETKERLQAFGVNIHDDREVEEALRRLLPSFSPLLIKGGGQNVFVFVGPTGVGKTTTLAKVAAELSTRHGAKVAIVTTDTFRVAAVSQGQIYADLLNIPFRVAYEPEELRKHVEALNEFDAVLVDMPGRSPSDTSGLEELQAYLDAIPQAQRLLLLEAGAQVENMRRVTEAFAAERCHGLIFTKLDETQVYGDMIEIAVEVDKPVIYLTTGQNVPQDIEPATLERFLSFAGLCSANVHETPKPEQEFVPISLKDMVGSRMGGSSW